MSADDWDVAGLRRVGEVTVELTGILGAAPAQPACPYAACELCDGCGVCRDFHGNFVAACGAGCPYGLWRRIRDALRRALARWRR